VELNFLDIMRDLLRVTLLVILLLYLGPQVVWVVVATAVSDLAFIVAGLLRSRQLVPQLRFRIEAVEPGRIAQLTNFGVWTTLGKLGSTLYLNAATILLNFFGTAVDVTIYHLGSTFFRQLVHVVGLASEPLQPVLTAMHAKGDHARLGRVMYKGGRYALWSTLLIAVPLAVYADEFVALYLNGNYPGAPLIIVLFMVIFPFAAPTALLARTAMATAKVRPYFLPDFLFLLLGFFVMCWLVAVLEWGAFGAVVSLAGTSIVAQLGYFWRLSVRLADGSFKNFIKLVLVPGLLPAMVGFAVWTTLEILVEPSDWISLVACGGIGACGYLITLLRFSLDYQDRRDLEGILDKLFSIRLR
jgi:O-antigen/teichoic acid export membrane protein